LLRKGVKLGRTGEAPKGKAHPPIEKGAGEQDSDLTVGLEQSSDIGQEIGRQQCCGAQQL